MEKIIKYKGKLGKIIMGMSEDTSGKMLFLPANYGNYYEKDLTILTEKDITDTTTEEKIEYLKSIFVWGKITKVTAINDGEFIIFEHEKSENKKQYHAYLNFEDTSHGYESLDSAIIGVITRKYDGYNSHANCYFEKMIGMDKGSD